MSNTVMGLASNEAREQNIMRLQVAFKHNKIITVHQAAEMFQKTPATIKKWAKDGNVPLIESNLKPTIVPWTNQNQPNHCPKDSTPGDGWEQYLKFRSV